MGFYSRSRSVRFDDALRKSAAYYYACRTQRIDNIVSFLGYSCLRHRPHAGPCRYDCRYILRPHFRSWRHRFCFLRLACRPYKHRLYFPCLHTSTSSWNSSRATAGYRSEKEIIILVNILKINLIQKEPVSLFETGSFAR